MIKVSYEEIIAKIKEKSSLSDEQINSRIKAKMDQLAGLISKEGAAHIIANELGIKLFEEGKLKIKDIKPGMRSVETVGKVTNIFEIRDFQRKDGSPGKVASFIVSDETSRIRVVLWNDQTDNLKNLAQDQVIKVKNALARENNNGSLELHLSRSSELIHNPEGETIGEIAQAQKPLRKKIEELSEADANIELLGTIVQAFEPRFYEVCPECNKRIRQQDSNFVCTAHGNVAPNYAYVMNLILDDGTSTIRAVFFRNQVANLLKMQEPEILKFKDSPADFQAVKDSLLGNQIKIIGRASKNEMFDRLEFIAQLVFPDPNPDEELKRLQEEAKIIE